MKSIGRAEAPMCKGQSGFSLKPYWPGLFSFVRGIPKIGLMRSLDEYGASQGGPSIAAMAGACL
jgi:hypothetical protein